MNQITIIGACGDCHATWKGRPSDRQHVNDWFAGALRACELDNTVLIIDLAPMGYECEVCGNGCE
jgi:hypothetical protein